MKPNSVSKNEYDLRNRKYEAIVMGASAGGISALQRLYRILPKTFGVPIIVVQHIANTHEFRFTDIFEESGKLMVKEAAEKEVPQPGSFYFAPSGYHLMIERDRSFSLSVDEPVCFSRPSIDVLFETAAEAYENQLVGVILTGANHDGAHGLRRIHSAGGIAIVQTLQDAEVDVMPKAAIAAVGTPDFIGSVEEIGAFLLKLVSDDSSSNVGTV